MSTKCTICCIDTHRHAQVIHLWQTFYTDYVARWIMPRDLYRRYNIAQLLLFNLVAALDNTADRNSYADSTFPNSFRKANLNRDPVHRQTSQQSSLELNHQL